MIEITASNEPQSNRSCDYCGHPKSSEHPSGFHLCSLDYHEDLAESLLEHGRKHWDFNKHSRYSDPELVQIAEDIRGGWTWRTDVLAAKAIRDAIDEAGGLTGRVLAQFSDNEMCTLRYGVYKFATLAGLGVEEVVEALHMHGMTANGSRAIAKRLISEGKLPRNPSTDPFYKTLSEMTGIKTTVEKQKSIYRKQRAEQHWGLPKLAKGFYTSPPELTNENGDRFCVRNRNGTIHVMRPAVGRHGQDDSKSICHYNAPNSGDVLYLSDNEINTREDVCTYCQNQY